MPAFGWRLNDSQVADVVNFIRSSWGNGVQTKVTAKQVAKLRQDDSVQPKQGSADIRVLEKQ
jgi:hypothetical protein